MPEIEIYTWSTCPYCIRAKQLLDQKGVTYTEHRIDGDEAARATMAVRASGRRTVPQIFVDGEGLGGCSDLYELEEQGRLDARLGRFGGPPSASP